MPVRKCIDDSKPIRLRSQEVVAARPSEPPPRHHGGLLSWSGFMAMCRDFKIATSSPPPSPNKNTKMVRAHRSSVDQQRLVTFSSSPQAATRRPHFNDWKPGDGCLLDVAQARIAFVSACTHGSVVAAFPEEACRAPRESASGGSPYERGPGGSNEVYWQVGCTMFRGIVYVVG